MIGLSAVVQWRSPSIRVNGVGGSVAVGGGVGVAVDGGAGVLVGGSAGVLVGGSAGVLVGDSSGGVEGSVSWFPGSGSVASSLVALSASRTRSRMAGSSPAATSPGQLVSP